MTVDVYINTSFLKWWDLISNQSEFEKKQMYVHLLKLKEIRFVYFFSEMKRSRCIFIFVQGDLSSNLGQLPAGAGMAMNSYSSGYGPGRSPRDATDEESTQGWDDNWDDWDQEEQRSKR